jgi:hypothetical protein
MRSWFRLSLSAAALTGALVLAACASSPVGGAYVDPNTCQIKGGPQTSATEAPKFDPECIKAAQQAIENRPKERPSQPRQRPQN